MVVAGAVATWALAGVFAYAVAAKLRSIEDFAATVSGLAPRLEGVRYAAAAALVGVESAAAILLLVRPRIGAELAIGVLLAFAAVAGLVHASGRHVRCSCFGASGSLLGLSTVVRNIGLAALALLVALAGTSQGDVRDVRLGVAAALLSASVITVAQGVGLAREVGAGLRRLEGGEA